MSLPQSWSLQSRAHHCHATGRKFKEGEHYYTAIFRLPNSADWHRQDYCSEAWEQQSPTFDPQPFSSWQGTFTLPKAKKATTKRSRIDIADSLLKRYLEENSPTTEKLRYILALLLERKKLLKPKGNIEGDVVLYEHSHTGDVIAIVDPHLTLEETAALGKEFEQCMQLEEAII